MINRLLMLKVEAKALIHLAWPLLIAQLTQMCMGVSDTIMAGRYDATDMAAVAVGFSLVNPIQFFIQGLALALPPVISRLQGANKPEGVAHATQQLGYLLGTLAVFLAVITPFIPQIIQLIPMTDSLRPITTEYVFYLFFCLPAFALYQWLRNYCEGLGLTKPTMVITLIGLGINIIANYVLIYGKFGAPEMGGIGCGLATALVFYGMLITFFVYVIKAKKLKPYKLFETLHRPDSTTMLAHLKLGVPIAMTILFEVSLFALVAILLAPFGTVPVASHQIALNVSALFFMFPLSIGMAVAIRVGYRMGQNNSEAAKHAIQSALLIGMGIALCTALLTIFGRQSIVHVYTKDEAVLSLAVSLLIFGAIFQFSDSIQAISANALRGYKDTTAMSVITFVSYWLIGLPTGVLLGRTTLFTEQPMAAKGFWIGFIVGLSAAAIMLGWRLRVVQARIAAGKFQNMQP